jgi:hypothetical protein
MAFDSGYSQSFRADDENNAPSASPKPTNPVPVRPSSEPGPTSYPTEPYQRNLADQALPLILVIALLLVLGSGVLLILRRNSEEE